MRIGIISAFTDYQRRGEHLRGVLQPQIGPLIAGLLPVARGRRLARPIAEEAAMRKTMLCCVAAALVLTGGCVSRARHQDVAAELEECRRDKLAAQEAAQFCNRRYAREVERWDDIQQVVEEVLPQTVKDFEAERDRIVAMMPEEIRREVDGYLSSFATAVARGFDRLTAQNREILAELKLYKSGLDEVGVRTRSIDESVTARLRESAIRLEEAAADRRRAARRVAEAANALIDEVQDFDQTYITDRGSPERLWLNRKQRETVSLFHDRLVRQLVELRDAAAEEVAGEGAAGVGG